MNSDMRAAASDTNSIGSFFIMDVIFFTRRNSITLCPAMQEPPAYRRSAVGAKMQNTVPCEVNVSMARNIARELETSRIINSKVVFSFGTKPEEVYNKLAPMINAKGVAYGYEE